ncbi:hypothetical protein [Methylobacterium iners]|uniref:Uncharacterized protein n=1 Tax=Methylobacterium iners TaxID=418707 RepID=A0ABQ4S1B2_9HYPH|nr:hypothetical protein [Methylobacterium iners]GJD96908.1 hypothetical protein OCOJLMKI_4135 [Methylobacterium iners]
MMNQDVSNALGVSIIGADLAKQISARLDFEDRKAGQWTQQRGEGDIPAMICEQSLRHTSGRRTPESISAT